MHGHEWISLPRRDYATESKSAPRVNYARVPCTFCTRTIQPPWPFGFASVWRAPSRRSIILPVCRNEILPCPHRAALENTRWFDANLIVPRMRRCLAGPSVRIRGLGVDKRADVCDGSAATMYIRWLIILVGFDGRICSVSGAWERERKKEKGESYPFEGINAWILIGVLKDPWDICDFFINLVEIGIDMIRDVPLQYSASSLASSGKFLYSNRRRGSIFFIPIPKAFEDCLEKFYLRFSISLECCTFIDQRRKIKTYVLCKSCSVVYKSTFTLNVNLWFIVRRPWLFLDVWIINSRDMYYYEETRERETGIWISQFLQHPFNLNSLHSSLFFSKKTKNNYYNVLLASWCSSCDD